MENPKEALVPIEIPIDSLSVEAIRGIIDSFIMREGTDYGMQEVPHEKKVEEIRRQLKQDQIKIVYDALSESITLLTKEQWNRQKIKCD